MYIASKLHKQMDLRFSSDEIIGKTLSYADVSKALNGILRPLGASIRVVRCSTLNTARDIFDFSGYFDIQKKRNKIRITLHVPKNRDSITITKSAYNRLRFHFSQVVQHEFIHLSQFSFRPEQAERKIKVYHSHKLSKQQVDEIEYLREWCEIEAYAHDIAMEINYFYPNRKPHAVINRIDNFTKLYSYKKYKEAFKSTEWNRLRTSLLRKCWKWIPVAHPPKKC